MLNKRNVFTFIALIINNVILEGPGICGAAPSSSTTPTTKTPSVPIQVQPAQNQNIFASELKSELLPSNNDKSVILELLIGGGTTVLSAAMSMGMVVVQSLLTKKAAESDFFNKNAPQFADFFQKNGETQAEQEKFVNNLLKDFKELKKQEILPKAKEQKETELLGKLEKEMAKTKAAIYRKQKEHFISLYKGNEEIIGQLTEKNDDTNNEVSNSPTQQQYGIKEINDSVRRTEAELIASEKKRMFDNIVASRHLESYYLSASQGEHRDELLQHPAVNTEVINSKKEFAQKIISTPTIYKNLSEKTQSDMHIQAKRGIEERAHIV